MWGVKLFRNRTPSHTIGGGRLEPGDRLVSRPRAESAFCQPGKPVKHPSEPTGGPAILPTLCAAAGVPLPADYRGDGENLLAALNGQPIQRTRPIFWEWTGKAAEPDWWPRLAVREGDWKLALTTDAKRVALHRLTTDPTEAIDVAKDHPEIVARLTQLALAWQATMPTAVDPACISAADRAAVPIAAPATPAQKAPLDRAAAFARIDTNHDGVLTLAEYLAAQAGGANLTARFKKFDKNGDGKISREEFLRP